MSGRSSEVQFFRYTSPEHSSTANGDTRFGNESDKHSETELEGGHQPAIDSDSRETEKFFRPQGFRGWVCWTVLVVLVLVVVVAIVLILESTIDFSGSCDRPDITNSDITPTSETISSGEYYDVECIEGYVRSGSFVVKCSRGKLDELPTCEPGPCRYSKPNIEDGTVSPDKSTISSGDSYEVTCNDETVISGPPTITCTAGKLSELPTCIGAPCISDDKVEIEHGTVQPETSTINHGESYTLTCNDGYFARGSGEMKCHRGELLSPSYFVCDPKRCRPKPNIKDGTVTPDQSPISSGASYEVICNDGFVISGPSTVTCTTGNLSQLPTCEPEDCKTKPNIEDGTVAPDQSPISSGASYEVTCNDGFVISGPSTVTCTTGNLSQLPTCEPAPCDKPNIDDGTVSPSSATIISGARYEVTCNDGFVISGPSTVTCTTGNLSQLPTCEPAPCTKPDIKDGTVTPETATISSGSSYEVTCNEVEGYVISGTSKISCSKGVLSELPTCDLTCPDCLFKWEDWVTNGDQSLYSATKTRCDPIFVNLADNVLSIKKSGSEQTEDVIESELFKNIPGMPTLAIKWKIASTMVNNETIKVEFFEEDRDGYAGCGEYDGEFFRAKPSGENKNEHMLWTSEDNPTYLPFYLSRDTDAAMCMFADAEGAPIEIKVGSSTTEWLIWAEEVTFYAYDGTSVEEALNKCTAKWTEIYPASSTSWTNDFIIGSLSPDQVKTDQERGTSSIASHYILSSSVVSMTDSNLDIEDGDAISDYSNIIIALTARQTITSGSGITLTPEKGFYMTDAVDTYILDFDDAYVQSKFDSYLSDTKAGFLLLGGLDLTSDDCSKYFHCSDTFVPDNNVCLSSEFGDGRVFEKHNFYDVSQRKALQPQQIDTHRIIETVASPGTANFYRSDLELTETGLNTCYHNLLNLRKLGFSVTCNMCAGVVPITADQKSLCFRWSQLSLLMPYVIISNEDVDLADALSNAGEDGFSKMKENIALRNQLYYYLATPGLSIQEKTNGFLIGDNIFMVYWGEGSTGKVDLLLPEGEWLAPNPDIDSGSWSKLYFDDNSPQEIDYEEKIHQLVYYKLDNIFVLKDNDEDDNVEVHIFQLDEDFINNPTRSTFTYDSNESEIELDPSSEEVTFTSSSTASDETKRKFTVSKIVVYMWTDQGNSVPSIEVAIVESERKSIFENWSKSVNEDDNDS